MQVVKGRLAPRELLICSLALLSAFSAYMLAVRGARIKEADELSVRSDKLTQEFVANQKIFASYGGAAALAAAANTGAAATGASKSSRPVQQYLDLNTNFRGLIEQLSGDGQSFRVNRLALDKQEAKTGFSKNTFTLEIETSFLKLGQFVEAIEKSDHFVEITSVEVTRMSQELKKCTAKIQLNSYVARN